MFGGKSFNPATDIPSLDGKVIFVTGGKSSFSCTEGYTELMRWKGNTGLGKEMIDQLAQHNPSHIYLAARTPSKGNAAVADVKKAMPSVNITFISLDLASFDSISSAAKDFTSKSPRLDLLINNAGVMALPPGTTKEGYEVQFGTNHVGHALLTKLLLPTLLSTAKEPVADVRIINLSSEGHRLAPSGGLKFDKDVLDQQGTWARYGQSKLANIMFTRELAARYPAITSVAIHPGVIKTDLYAPNQNSSMIMRYGMMVFSPLMKTVTTGAYNQLWAATTKKEELTNGAYYTPVGSKSNGGGYAQDQKLSKELWDWTEKELSSKGF